MRKIVSITTVKNEADIIESFVRYNLNIVDLMIILNNGSTDDTNFILDSLVSENLPIIVLNDKDKYFEPQEKYNFLLKKAFDECGADIVCTLDADEFIISENGENPRDSLLEIDEHTYYRLKWKTYVPTKFDNDDKFIPSRITHIRDESIEILPKVVLTKELFYDFGVELPTGNHDLEFNKKELLNKKIFRKECSDLKIAHFPLRSVEQTTSKVLVSYPNTLSRKFVSPDVSHHYPIMFNKILNEGQIEIEDVTEFAKQYSLRENKGKEKFEIRDIKVYSSPINLDFCENIEIKYDFKISPLNNVLNNYVYFANEIHRFKNEKESDSINFENKIMEVQNNYLNLENSLKTNIQSLENKLNKISKFFDSDELDQFKKMETFMKLIKKDYSHINVAVKTPNTTKNRHWGDYFFAHALNDSLLKFGFNAKVYENEFWYEDDSDIVIVLRGLFDYNPNPGQINIMWNISHPDDVPLEEFNKYDCVFIASEKYAQEINQKASVLTKPLLQCTNPNLFFPNPTEEFNEEILFVGVTRGIFRPIVQDLLKTSHDVSVYGMGWEKFIDEKYIKGEFIQNNILNNAYSSCKILLNDHWDDMKEKDFISNRLFDALACKAFVISDEVDSISHLFEGNVVTYTDADDLNKKLDYYLENDEERNRMAERGYEIVVKNHTFDNRVDEIVNTLEKDGFYQFINEFNSFVDNVDFDRSFVKKELYLIISNLIEELFKLKSV